MKKLLFNIGVFKHKNGVLNADNAHALRFVDHADDYYCFINLKHY